MQAAVYGHLDIVKYFVEERKITDDLKRACMINTAKFGQLDCLKYLVEEGKMPLNAIHRDICVFRATRLVNYLLTKGCPEPTEEEYAHAVAFFKERFGQTTANRVGAPPL